VTCPDSDDEPRPWDWADLRAAQAIAETFGYELEAIRRARPCWPRHMAQALREAYQSGADGVPVERLLSEDDAQAVTAEMTDD
jgi:hypothetical protein